MLSNSFQAAKLAEVIAKSGNSVEAYWPALFAKALRGQDMSELMNTVASAGPAAGAAAAAGGEAAAEDAPAAVEKKEEVENVDMGGLFGDEDDY